MIKPFFIIIATLLLSLSIAAKSKKEVPLTVVKKDSVLGYTTDKHPIQATYYQFAENIFQASLDAQQNQALLLLKDLNQKNGIYGPGALTAFNFQTGNFDWHFTVKGTDIKRSKDAIYYKNGANAALFSVTDGAQIRKVPGPYLFMDYQSNIAFGGEYGVDLISGKCIWRHPVTAENGERPDELYHIDDSLIAFCYGGLHVLNLYTGKGWDYKLSTTKSNIAATESDLGIAGAGLILGIFTGALILPGGHNSTGRLSGFNSNVTTDNGLIYMADKLGLLCWDAKTGELIWRQKISRSKMSGSEIFVKGQSVYIINKGIADQGSVGAPFIAAYDKISGAETFFETLGNGGITSYAIKNDTCWVYSGDLYRIDLSTGKYISKKFWAGRNITPNRWFANVYDLFIENNKGVLEGIDKIFPDCFFMIAQNCEVYVFNTNAELKQVLKPGNYWLVSQQYKDCHMLMNGKGETAFERNRKKLFALPPANRTEIVGDKLFRIVDKGLQVISLSDLLAN